jgi:RNA polymerase sigma-70 factor (ECF subfamily)
VESVTVAGDLRALYPRVLGKTLALTGSLADAEDAVHDAIERALGTWPRTGAPDSPEAWLLSVAANCHRDRVRRGKREERHADALAALAQMSPWVQGAIAAAEIASGWKDDLLRIVFACCHPCLDTGESAALALATVLGLSSAEIAQAFALAPRSMDQRLTRARRRLRERGASEAPRVDAARDRLDAVLTVVHLLFNEGYWSTRDDSPIRGDLCRLALGLGRSLREIFPVDPEVLGLLALMILHEARRPARTDAAGAPVTLPEQNRALWDAEAIAEGTALLDAALRGGAPGPFQIEAAISATHCRARAAAETEWSEIAELYALLERMRPSPATRVNRAFAVARARGALEGLRLLDESGGAIVAGYPYANLVRGALLEELGRNDAAVAALEQAASAARNAHEARQIGERITRIRERGRS